MSAKNILTRYAERKCALIPKEELHQHLAGVASRDSLIVTEEELEEVVLKITGEEKPNKRRRSTKKDKTGSNVKD